jgi:hypothetical protein
MSSFLAIDFETANQSRDSACSVGLVRVEKSKIVHKAVHLIRPPSRDFMFTYIHGISWRDVASQPTFKEIWKEISPPDDMSLNRRKAFKKMLNDKFPPVASLLAEAIAARQIQ